MQANNKKNDGNCYWKAGPTWFGTTQLRTQIILYHDLSFKKSIRTGKVAKYTF